MSSQAARTFDVAEQDLRAVFLPYGPVYSIRIDTDKGLMRNGGNDEGSSQSGLSPKKKGRREGIAFGWMLSKKDAERTLRLPTGD